MVKPKHRQNSLPLEYKEETIPSEEQQLVWLTSFWKFLGIEETPTIQDLRNRSRIELEFNLMKEKCLKDN